MTLSELPWKDLVTIGAAALGAGLGILNYWNAFNQRQVRLRIIPGHSRFHRAGGQLGILTNNRALSAEHIDATSMVSIEILNLSAFPVTINEVGFTYDSRYVGKSRRIVPVSKTSDGKALPIKLEPRTSVSLYMPLMELLDFRDHIGRAYAQTACDVIAYGTNKSLKDFKAIVR